MDKMESVEANEIRDPWLWNDWHPVVAAAGLVAGDLQVARLQNEELVLWRDAQGVVHAWDDRCPHRGARLSLGHVAGDRIVCAYHGWQFDQSGRCMLQPAQPRETPPATACARRFHVREAYGMVWVCLGEPALEPPPFPEYGQPQLRKVLCGPYVVQACGTRIIENFLDMAHFGFIHEGVLGDVQHTEVPDYQVGPHDDGLSTRGLRGVIATGCFAWQPVSNLLAAEGSMVEYTYRVVRPLTAILTKLPRQQQGFAEAISLHVQPVSETVSQAWVVLALTDAVSSDEQLRAFQDRIFKQDLAILESQRPKRVPLLPGVEIPQRADRLSAAYRRMLGDLGMRWGLM
jgi:phenylpropionate dioxygenase-like ring-hydroxylating dioxygenase large terminal subunit